MTPRPTIPHSACLVAALVFAGCANPPAPIAPRPSTPSPIVDASSPFDVRSAPPPSEAPAFALGDQASGARAFARGITGYVVRGALAFPGVDGALLVVGERADGGAAEWRVFVLLASDRDAGPPASALLAAVPVEIAVNTLDAARGPALLVRYDDPHVLPSVKVFPLRPAAPWVGDPARDIAWLDGVPCLTHADARAPAPGNLGPAAVAGRTPLAGVSALAAGPAASLVRLLAADFVWCTAHGGNPSTPMVCRAVPPAQRDARWVASTLRPALRSLVTSEAHEQGPDSIEGATGSDRRVRVEFVGAGVGRRIQRIEVTSSDLGE